jgi:ABC-type dipeptide/oligopeptide/nickel transport system permease subunit
VVALPASSRVQLPAHGRAWRLPPLPRVGLLPLAAAFVLATLTVLAFAAPAVPAIERHEPTRTDFDASFARPNAEHPLGADRLGRDTWARTLEGYRISVGVALASQALAVVLGLVVGTGAALGPRWLRGALMRLTDVGLAFPDLPALVLLRGVWGGGPAWMPSGELFVVSLAIGLLTWMLIARAVRASLLATRESEYVLAARALGGSPLRVALRHQLPAAAGVALTLAAIGIPLAIFAESTLGYLGLSVAPPTASLGTLISDGLHDYRSDPWLLAVPCAATVLLTTCVFVLADALRDRLPPAISK